MNTDYINRISKEEESESFQILGNEMLNSVHKKKVKYGYYSETQKKITGTIFVYLNSNGENITVTEISDKDKNNMESNFDDIIYMGEVITYVKKYNIGLKENNLLDIN